VKRDTKILLIIAAIVFILIWGAPKVIEAVKNLTREATAKKVVSQWRPLADSWASAWDTLPQNILAIICQESGGNPQAVNKRDPSRGLMAVTPGALQDFNNANGKSYSFDDLYDPEKNVEVGSWYFATRAKSSLTHNLKELFEAYNAGLGNLPAGVPYAESVMDYLTHVEDVYYS
jgi:soluble lytic murein transglycosylase-like protein